MILYEVPALFVIALIASAITFPWRNEESRRAARILILGIVPPVACAFWSSKFAVDAGSFDPARPWWIGAFFAIPILVSGAMLVGFALKLSSVRPFAISIGLTTLCATLAASFMGVMQTSGAWV